MLEVGSWWPRGAAVSELGEGPSRLSIWGTVVLSTEGTAHLADPQQVYTWPAHVHGGSASYAGLGGLLWALKLFLPGARGFWTRDASGWERRGRQAAAGRREVMDGGLTRDTMDARFSFSKKKRKAIKN